MAVSAAFAAVAVSAGAAVDSAKRQDYAQRLNTGRAQEAAKAQDEANNKVNQKRPDTSALYSANQQSAKNGPSSTMLTGSSGVDPSALQLGKSTLLGG